MRARAVVRCKVRQVRGLLGEISVSLRELVFAAVRSTVRAIEAPQYKATASELARREGIRLSN